MISRDRGAPPADESAGESIPPAAEAPAAAPAVAGSPGAPGRRRRPRAALWGAAAAGTAILILGAHALSSRGTARSRPRPAERRPAAGHPQPGAPSAIMGPPAPVHFGPDQVPEMPTLLFGPPAPERPAPGGVRIARGPGYLGAPLPPIAGLGGFTVPPPGPAVPVGIVPRAPGVPPPAEAAPRPLRSAETSEQKPLGLRVSLDEAASSPQGPGAWLKVRASGSGPCYVAIFHVDGERHVSIVFPRRFDIPYQPNVTYNLMTRSAPGETGEVVVAVAAVYPLTAADALAAIQASRALAPASARGALSSDLWEALEAYLKSRANGEAKLKEWDRHAWRVAMAVHRAPTPKPTPEAGSGEPPNPPGTGGGTDAPGTGGG
jgi:hypothetical protein